MDFGSLGAGAAGGAVVSIVIKASDEFSDVFSKATTNMGFLGQATGGLIAAVGASVAVIGGMTTALGEMAIKAAEAGDVQEAFNRLAGEEGVVALQNMTDATMGTISQVNLMKSANQSLIRGMTDEDLPILAKYGQQLADLGTGTVVDNINAITEANATGRLAHLKGLGVVIDQNLAYKKYAESIGLVNDKKADELTLEEASIKKKMEYYESIGGSRRMLKELQKELKAVQEEQKKNISSTSDFSQVLDDSQKKIANHAAIIEGVTEASKKLPEPIVDAKDAVQQLSASWENFQIKIGTTLGGAMQNIITNLLPIVQHLADVFMTLVLPALQDVFEAFGNLSAALGQTDNMNVLITVLGYLLKGMAAIVVILIDAAVGFVNLGNIALQWGDIIVDVVEHKAIAAFHLLSDSWKLTKNLFQLGALEIELFFENMVNKIVGSLETILNAIVGWINGVIDTYDAVADKLGWGHIDPLSNFNLSHFMMNTSGLQTQVSQLQGQVAQNVQNINIDIQQLTGVNPEDMAKALRKELNDLVTT